MPKARAITTDQIRPPAAARGLQWRELVRSLAIGLVYFLAVRFSLLFPDSAGVMAAVWPPSGIALGVLLLSRKRNWLLALIAIGIANFLGNISFGKSIPVSLGYLMANLMEPVFAFWFITRWFAQPVRFARVSEVLALLGAAVLMNGCTSLLGAAAASLGAGAPFWPAYASWWVADGMGMLFVAPLVVTWVAGASDLLRTMQRKQLAELVLFVTVWCVSVWLIFGPNSSNQVVPLRPYMLAPLLAWVALRFRPCIAAAASAILAVVAVAYVETSLGAVILAGKDPANRLAFIQVYLALMSTIAFLLSVSIFERTQLEHRLRESEQHFRTLADSSSTLIWGSGLDKLCNYFNEPWLRFTGRSLEQELGNGWAEGVHPEDFDRCLQTYVTAFDQRKSFSMEYRLRHADGSYRWIRDDGNPRYDAQGEFLGYIGYCMDVTEHKRSEAAVEESERKHRSLFESASDGIFLLDATGFFDCNRRGAEMYGMPKEKIIGCSPADLSPERQPDGRLSSVVAAEKIEAAFRGESLAFEWQALRADRACLEVEITLNRIEIGGSAGVQAIVRDISARKRAEEALRKSQRNLVEAQKMAHIGSWELDLAQNRLTWSEEMYRIFGIPQDEFGAAYETFLDTLHPDDRDMVDRAYLSSLEQGGRYDIEYRIIHKSDGMLHWGHARCEHERDGNGKALRSYGTVEDITERKRTEAELRESEARFRQMFENNASVLMLLEPESGAIVDANAAAARFYGYPIDRIRAMRIDQINALPPAEVAADRKFAMHEERNHFIFPHRLASGEIKTVEVRSTPISVGGRILLFSIIVDITAQTQAEAERARLETQLRESQKLEALGTLAGGVAHDFNNALATIIGNVELARQDVGPGHAALVSLEEISKASRRSKDLVQQILAFGRRQTLERKPTSLALVVVESARLIRAALPARVSLMVECMQDAPAVMADATAVKQILLNLCSNALHAIQDQERPGVIEVRLEACTRGAARGGPLPGRYACLTVRDNGSGMDEATRSRIFEPFFTTKPVGMGTGLGLPVVHGLVQAHGASVEVESSPGEGSTFRIYFPAVDEQVPAVIAPATDTGTVDGKGKHILYVDDEEAIVFLMKRLLERQGYRVSGYTDPCQALAAARVNPVEFDLVVTDYNMPCMSGLDLAQALKEVRPELPVVLASGYITEELRAKAPSAGISELIYKPNTVDELCEAVARFASAQSGNMSSH